MPIQIPSVNSTNISVKNALDKLAREAQKLTNVAQSGGLWTTVVPTVTTLDEGAFQFVNTAGAWRIYTKINNTLYYFTLTAA